jgi:prepilin-type N-terminal cleavage/methylation domain-containing protein
MRVRRAFSLGELLVALAIVAILSAMTLPMVFSKIEAAQEKALADTFSSLSQSIAQFRSQVGTYPLLLSSLTTAPASGDNNLCAATYGATKVALWRGPYTSRTVTTNGILVGDYTIQNQMRRVTSTTPNTMQIDVGSVPTSIVDDLEERIDAGTASGTTGTIQFTTAAVGVLGAAAAGSYNLSYAIPIASSCP